MVSTYSQRCYSGTIRSTMGSSALRIGAVLAVGAVLSLTGTGQGRPPFSKPAFLDQLAAVAVARDGLRVAYVSAYVRMSYPGGDVPADSGVCTDEIMRSYRVLGIDLQKEVHEDMLHNFAAYPRKWGAKRTDTNIDHRRVPNLMVFFTRKGERLPVTRNEADYLPGEIVTWELPRGLPHIGIVVDRTVDSSSRHKVLHNIGYGPKVEDVLFAWKTTGHYRYYGSGRR